MMNKIDKHLIKLTKKKEETQITNGRNGKRDIITAHNYSHKLDNLDETDRFLKRYNLPKFTEEINNLDSPSLYDIIM